ncbi:hypothetical protein J1614_011764 [Plenodomus biglobosus]|nr:hypothetical protein J1614_011764 [Plenodomus biglobosus]
MQNTDIHNATVMAANFILVGYSKSSSSSAAATSVELRFDVESRGTWSSPTTAPFSAVPVMGSVASAGSPAAGGMTVSATPFFSLTDGAVLWVAVFSESAMLEGRRWLFEPVI